MRTIGSTSLILIALACNLSAQNWSANAATAVPNFQSNGIVKTMTVDTTVHGRGVRPRFTAEGAGTSYVYVPVTAPQGVGFGCIGLRAADNNGNGSIVAEFMRQPRDANPGPAVTLGSVASINAPGDGFQFVVAGFPPQILNYNLNTYYIRITMTYQNAAGAFIPSPIAFDVSLSPGCH